MRTLSTALCSLLAAVLLSAFPTHLNAQSSQGGLRGVVKDSQGVIPGVTVTMVNEANGVSRDTVTNGVGEYSFPAIEPGTYTVKASVQGYKTFERKAVPVSVQQFLGLDITLEIGALEETITVTGESPLIETTNASTGDVLDTTLARVDSERRPQRVPDGEPDADGADQRQRALEPHAGSGRQLGDVDGRRRGARQQLPGRRLPGHRPAEPRLDQPDDRSRAGRQGAGPHLRRGDGTHRRRRDEHGGEVGRQRVPRLRLHRVPSRVAGLRSC